MTDLAAVIVVKKYDERLCGMKACPFHQWAVISNPSHKPIESICTLPYKGNGESGNVLTCYPFHQGYDAKQRINGKTKRLTKCLAVKPLSKK
jgi:hypothetical protein